MYIAYHVPSTPKESICPIIKEHPILNIAIEVTEENMVNLTSPAARSAFGRVNAIGQNTLAMMAKETIIETALSDASGDRLKHATRGSANTAMSRLKTFIAIKVSVISLRV